MDPQDVIAMALEIVLERERRNIRLMKESLRAQKVAVREKGRERSMLKRKRKRMLAKEGAKKKLIDDFMVFTTAIENNDLETAQNFDEKTMMNAVATMMNSDTVDNGEFAGGYGDNNLLGIDLTLEEKAAIDAIAALENRVGSSVGDYGGFAGGNGNSNLPGIDVGLEEKATMDAIVAPENGVGSSGGQNGGFAGGHGGINNTSENTHNHGEEDEMTAVEGTNSNIDEGSNAGGYGGSYSGNYRK